MSKTRYITTYYHNEGAGSGLTISVATGYTIDSIVINYTTTATGTLKVGSTTLDAVSADYTTDTVNFAEADNVKSVVITNTSTAQFRIASIVITYTKIA